MKKVEEGRRKRGRGGEKKWEGWWKEETRVRAEHKKKRGRMEQAGVHLYNAHND